MKKIFILVVVLLGFSFYGCEKKSCELIPKPGYDIVGTDENCYYLPNDYSNDNGNGSGTFTDTRDNMVYNWVKIGDQIWMAENLKYLPSVSGINSGSASAPNYYVYDYNGTNVSVAKATSNYVTYGVLYNRPAAMDGSASSSSNPSGVQGVCPNGWHLPSDAEWTEMESYLADNGYNYDGTIGGGSSKIAKSLASSSGWDASTEIGAVGNTDYPNYRNKSGFTALPGGLSFYGSVEEFFSGIGYSGRWWSATQYDGSACYRIIDSGNSCVYNMVGLGREAEDLALGLSVRCVKD